MNIVPLYFLDSLTDLYGNEMEPACSVQILTGFPDYARLVAYGTDFFDARKIFAPDRKSFAVQQIKYRIALLDPWDEESGIAHQMQKYIHPFESAPVLFQDGILRFKHDQPMLQAHEELEGLPKLAPEYLYFQFIN